MPQFNKRGNRIRASDKSLVFRFSAGLLLPLFFVVVLLLNLKTILTTDWKSVSFLKDGSVHLTVTSYMIVTVIVSALFCAIAALLYQRFQYDRVKQLFHRQKLAKMILENGWYESETTQDSGFFKDLPATNKKEKITYFPKLYYRMDNGLLYIRTEITLGKYQDQLLHLEKKLETGLYCELVSKELHDSYVEYVLLYDTIANRITIDEVQAENGSLRLMKNVWWEYDKLPHMLIAGGTGGGKTYFILTIIQALLRCNAIMYVLDPKNADLADLSVVMPEVYYKKEDITDCIDRFYDGMIARSEAMKLMENYKTGENYAYLGLAPHFLIFDEYVAFMEMLTTKENAAVLNKLKQIVMLGRQAGYFLILACQRPDAKYLGDGIRDQFNFRVALGRMSELGYSMMFGEVDKDFFLKQIKGRGYVDTGTSVISEFYTPLVPKGHDFLKEIGLNERYEEYAIHDYELPFEIDEYTPIEEVNRLCEMVEDLPEDIQDELSELLCYYSSLEELCEHADDIIHYPDCDDMTDVAYYFIDECQSLGEIPDRIRNYIDYEAYGRDLDLEGHFVVTNHGVFECPY